MANLQSTLADIFSDLSEPPYAVHCKPDKPGFSTKSYLHKMCSFTLIVYWPIWAFLLSHEP
jgi:hypothetical protein